MCSILRKSTILSLKKFKCNKLTSCYYNHNCKLLVVGGGSGGCSVTWRLSKKFKRNEIIVLEPSEVHYFQPLFSLVAAGIKKLPESERPLQSVLPRDVRWIKDHAEEFEPCNNVVHTRCGDKIIYDFMVIAVGLKNNYFKIPGLLKELDNPNSCVVTSYSPKYCEKVWCCIQKFNGGHALFTFPRQVGKCSGAALKIAFLADDYWRMQKIRHNASITYNSAGDYLFGVQKYSKALNRIVLNRNIALNCKMELIELNKRGAIFITNDGQILNFPYNFLHVTPPMSPPDCLTRCEALATETGYLDVDKYTLQHRCFNNIYGVGDCTNTPNSKTAAAVASQSYVVASNLSSTVEGKVPALKYNGYGACPILTSYKSGILAESVYDKRPWETFPFDQSKEQRLVYYLNKNVFPYLYWNKLIKGKWNGPAVLRKIINPLGR